MAILGIDEVGRGPWAGPLVIGAVVLGDPSAAHWAPLTDSKALTAKKREALAPLILERASGSALGWVSSQELDSLGMSRALALATRRAVAEIQRQHTPFSEIIIDGTVNFLQHTSLESYVTKLKKADLLIKEVSAASIIAKVARDAYMTALAERYPGYGFEQHMGYGTAFHRQALAEKGPCPEHRQSFRPIRELTGENSSVPSASDAGQSSTSAIGSRAEGVAADYLETNGHTILARNHKTKFYEIDIISILDDHIYFTEVKYRKNSDHGSPLEMVNRQKLSRMTFAAESFFRYQPSLRRFTPLLAVAAVSGPDFRLDDWFPLKYEGKSTSQTYCTLS